MLQTKPAHVHEDRLFIHNLVKRDPLAGFAEDVRYGLSAPLKRFLPKYFYDELGSQLFTDANSSYAGLGRRVTKSDR